MAALERSPKAVNIYAGALRLSRAIALERNLLGENILTRCGNSK